MIEEACFQNQIAVDLFKSAKKPDMEVIAENKRYLYRDVNYIKDKKLSSAYLNEYITTTGYSPVELLINQTNKYFQESHLESRPIIQFQELFKGVEFTPQQKYQAILAKQEFDDKFNEATRLNKRRETEQGPYAIVKTSSGTQIAISNLTRYQHPGIWKSSTLNIRLSEISEKYRSSERPHSLLAIAQIDGEMEGGEPKYRQLGTVSQQSIIDHKLKAGMTTEGATLVEIKPELRESQIKLLFQDAYAVAENFYILIPEDQKLAAAAATWNISASRQDELEQGDNSAVSSRKKVSNFVFATFGDEIVARLNDLQFTQLKVLGIGKEGDNFVGREWNPLQKYEIEIKASEYPPEHERHGSRLVFVKNDDGEYKEFAVLEQRTGQLPIGTQAQAYITPGEAYTATATINLPSQAPINITIREISKFSHAGKIFNGEKVNLTIGNVPVPVDTAKIKLDGQILGELDADSIRELRKINYLGNDNPLKLKFKSIGNNKEEGGFIIAESPNGNLLKINKINLYDFKGQTFADQEYRTASLEIPTIKNRDAVFLDGELLGVLHYKKDREFLQNLGVLKPGQKGSVDCSLQSNFSHTFVNLDASTVQYPEIWTKDSQACKDNSQTIGVNKQEVMLEKSALFLQKIKERPTILFRSQEDEVLGLMGMAVDNHKTVLVQNWLKSKGVEFNVLKPQDVPLESKKGLSVLYLVSNTIQDDEINAFKAKFGQPLNANGKNSAYYNRLNSLPNRPQIIREKSDTILKSVSRTIPVTVTSNLSDSSLLTETPVGSQNYQTVSAVSQGLLPVNTTFVSKPQEQDVVISGKPVQMVFPLKMHGEPNPLPVRTTIDAMRGYGRCHTTRTYEPYKAYGFKEGDIAIASSTFSKNASGTMKSAIASGGVKPIALSVSQQVAFRVGKQYRITQEMIADPAYQQQWAAMEKHSAQELTTFRNKLEVWGLQMEPLGDYVNGKIIPFPNQNVEQFLAAPAVSPFLPTATPPTTTISSPVNIGSKSSDPLGAALANPTVEAKELGKIQGDYPVFFRDNAAVPAGKYGPETYTQDKANGIPFLSAEQAYQHYKTTVALEAQREQLMTEIIQAKLEQHPKLFAAITQRGGVEWLENCTHYVTSNRDNYWEGKGKESPFIRALIEGYSRVLENSLFVIPQVSPELQPKHSQQTIVTSPELQPKDSQQTVATFPKSLPKDSEQEITTSPKTSNPLAHLQPLNAAVAPHMQKDVAMAEVATQFIGISSAPPETRSSTRNYQQAWGDRANTGVYSVNDTIMVSGSGPWRGVTQQQILETFTNHYVPLIDKAIASNSSFVVGNAAGTDQLVQQYLHTHGYKLETVRDGYTRAVQLEKDAVLGNIQAQSIAGAIEEVPFPPPPTQPFSVLSPDNIKSATPDPPLKSLATSSPSISQKEVIADTTTRYEETTIENLRNWYSAAQKLGKSAEYLQRIAEVGNEFKSGTSLTEKALITMNKDLQELHSFNRLTQIAQRIGDILGTPKQDGGLIVQGKEYSISINNSRKDLTIFQKNGTVLLDIQSGQVKNNQVSTEVIDMFEKINNSINQSLASVKNEYIQV